MLFNRVVPIFLGLALIMLVGFNVSQNLGQNYSLHYDEFYSLERSHGFEKFEDWWSVYSLNEPTAKKPPLQYWMSGLAMKLGMSDVLALRIWSWVFFIGVLVVTAWTSYVLKPDNVWVIPATVLLLGCSLQFVDLARSGLLDAGLGFFMMASLLAFLGARTNPKLWILCGVLIGLGALQKAPVALLFIAIMLYIYKRKQDTDYQWSTLRQNSYFNRGLWIAVVMFLSWPILQTFKFGSSYLQVAVKKQMLDRFSPLRAEAETRSGAWDWVDWLWSDLHWGAILVVLAVVAAVIAPRWRRDNSTFALALLACIIILGFTLASGKIYSRYLAVLTPIMICVTVKVIADLVAWKPGVFLVAAVFFGLSFTSVQQFIENEDDDDSYRRAQQRVAYIDQFRLDSDFVVFNRTLIPPGAYGYFGKSRQTFRAYDVVDDRELEKIMDNLGPETSNNAVLGFDLVSNKAQLEQKMPGIQIVDAGDEFMIWRFVPQ